MTEPISDEDLEWFRRSLASDRHGIRIEMGTEQLRGVLTRLDAAEARAKWADQLLQREIASRKKYRAEHDAAYAEIRRMRND